MQSNITRAKGEVAAQTYLKGLAKGLRYADLGDTGWDGPRR